MVLFACSMGDTREEALSAEAGGEANPAKLGEGGDVVAGIGKKMRENSGKMRQIRGKCEKCGKKCNIQFGFVKMVEASRNPYVYQDAC